VRALERGGIDLVISDYSLPSFDGIRALELLHEKLPGTPYIFVSGTSGEDLAIDTMKRGATDYVLKTRISRLVPAVRRALSESEERARRKEAEDQFRVIAESASDLFAVLDLEGKRLYNSPSYKSLLGDPAKLRGTDSFQEIHPEDRERIKRIFRETVKTGVGQRAGFRFLLHDGSVRYIESQGSVVRDSAGRIARIVVVSRDVTGRKEAEEALRKLSSAVEQTADGVVITNREGVIEYVNPAFEAITGHSKEFAIGKTPRILKSGEQSPEYYKKLWQTILAGETFRDVVINRKASGELFYEEQTVTPITDNKGEITHFVSTGRDITERNKSEKVQRTLYRIAQAAESSHQLDDLFRAIHGIVKDVMSAENFYIALYDENSNLLSFPYFVDEVDQPSPAQSPGRGLTEYVLRTGKSLLCGEALHQSLIEQGEADLVGAPSLIWLGVPLKIENRTIGIMVVQHYEHASAYGEQEKEILEYISSQVARVIDRKGAEQALELAHSQLKSLHDSLDEALFSVDIVQNKMLQVSVAHQSVFGCPPEAFLKNPQLWYELIVPEDKPIIDAGYPVLMSGRSIQHQFRVTHPDGKIRWIEARIKPTLDTNGKLVRVDGIASDITQRKQADEALVQSEQRYRTLFEESKDGLFISTAEGKIIDVNPAVVRILGYVSKEEMLKVDVAKDIYVDPSDRERLLQRLSDEDYVEDFETVQRRKDGQELHVLLSVTAVRDKEGNILLIRGLLRDVTKQRQLEQQLVQAQKMESLGTLAGGIAHDFNNILGIIMGHASLLENPRRDAAQHSRSTEAIAKSAQRGAALVRQLLTFARKTDVTLESIVLNAVVVEVARLLEETFPKIIAVSTDLQENLPSIVADATQVHQVLLNLCVNARDAMLPRGGMLVISTRLVESETVRKKFRDAEALEYVLLTVADSGTGMDEATRIRVFEPFFTTKEKGKGTGLGLATVYGIVEAHNGFIDVESEAGHGATFLVYFPVLPRQIEAPEPEREPIAEIPGGTETILLVEDEEMLRDFVTVVLSGKGYTVLTAGDGAEAIGMYSRDNAKISLVLTDLGLPKLGGEPLVRGIKEINPSARIVVASGHMDPDLKEELFGAGAMEFIHKPFRPNELLRKVRDALDSPTV